MITSDDSVAVITKSAIVVNSQGIIRPSFAQVSEFNEFEESSPFNQDFPRWPCHSGRDYEASFRSFMLSANLNPDSLDFTEAFRLMKNKIRVLQRSPYANLLAGPCLPIIQPQTCSSQYYDSLLSFFWTRLDGSHRRKVDYLPGKLLMKDQSEFNLPLRPETLRVRLIFPQALPPLSIEDMNGFTDLLKSQHSLSLAGPLEMLCAMMAFPSVFRGNFRFFFPNFFIIKKDEEKNSSASIVGGHQDREPITLMPFLAFNRNTLSFQATGSIEPKIFDFCPIIF
ncbi:MAG: hypothetical protein WC905_00520 [Patescibacteria group bacterium]|jgi:hypothetical protein